MYDMYPEWGPARHRDPGFASGRDASYDTGHGTGSGRGRRSTGDRALASVQAGLDLRDNGGQRPDDN